MTATDVDLTQLADQLAENPDFMDQLMLALRSRPRNQPMFNMAGQRIDALAAAPTGRVQVSPGQTISSASWGNPVWDQSINCFATTADRDTQWPTPHEGSECYTVDTGSPWVYRSGAWHGRPRGFLAYGAGPVSMVNFVAMSTVITASVPVVQGRRYRISGNIVMNLQTASGSMRAQLIDDQGGQQWIIVGANNTVVGQTLSGSGTLFYTPTTTKTVPFQLQAQCTPAGQAQIQANGGNILVEDIGN